MGNGEASDAELQNRHVGMPDPSPAPVTPAAEVRKPSILLRLFAWTGHRVPLLSGLTPLSFNPAMNRLCGATNYTTSARTHSGLDISVDINDYHGRILYLFGTNDPKVQAMAAMLLEQGDTFLDIGANYSTIGLFAARKIAPTGRVHLFEPQPYLADRVQQCITAGGVKNVLIHRVALLDKDDTLTLKIPPNHSGMATLIDEKRSDTTNWKPITVPVRKIDSYVAPLVASGRFGVKIDVEGAEPHLIPWIVGQANLKFMIFEAAHNHAQLFGQVTSAGMTIFGLRRTLFRKQVQQVNSVGELRQFHDLVAVRTVNTAPHSAMPMRKLSALIK